MPKSEIPQLLSKKQVAAATGLSRSTIDRERRANRFPRPLQISCRRVAWPAPDIAVWIADRDRASCDRSTG
jgi:prophage regulatory protein